MTNMYPWQTGLPWHEENNHNEHVQKQRLVDSRTCSIGSIQVHSEALWATLRVLSPVKNSLKSHKARCHAGGLLFCCCFLSLVWRYLICAFGGGGFGDGAYWAPGEGKGADSALRPPRSCSSSCLPDWRAVDQPESSSLNTKSDSGELPGAYYTQAFKSLERVCDV